MPLSAPSNVRWRKHVDNIFPLVYSADSRYLVDQTGHPFPIKGRTAWFITSLSVTDYQTFLADCLSRHYNAIEFHVINHDPRGNNPPFNGNGDVPFSKRLDGTSWNGSFSGSAPDFTQPNETFWTYVDTLLSYCATNGILCFMFPAYVGYAGGDQGWMVQMTANGAAKMQTYGAWIANRYKSYGNIVWMMGGDMGTSPNTFSGAQTALEQGLLDGLQSVAGQQSTLMSAEWSRESISPDQTDFGSDMTLNGVYVGPQVSYQGHRAYSYTPKFPAFLLEEPYDQEGSDGNSYNLNATQPVRRFQYWGWLTTIGGYISGNGYVWGFNSPDWQNHLDTQGSRDMARMNALIDSIEWWKLKPSGYDGMMTIITAGNSFSDTQSQFCTAAADPNGTVCIIYIPPDHTGTITVNQTVMRANYRARWFDPTAGYTDIGIYAASSTRVFTIPGNNSQGEGDWVLHLDSPTDTSYALSASQTDVQAAITAASDGQKVVIPDGSATWTSGITTTKQVWIRALNYTPTTLGTASRSVSITNNAGTSPLLSLTSGNSFSVGVTGIKFLEGTGTSNHIKLLGSGTKVPLIADCYFEVKQRNGNSIDVAIIDVQCQGGVFWNCKWQGLGDGTAPPNDPYPDGACVVLKPPARPWHSDGTMGDRDTDGTINTYFEDCTFINVGQCPDNDDNGRFVFRHNVLDGAWGLTHGLSSADAGRHFEYYNNTFSVTSPYRNMASRYFFCRAGTGIFTDNVVNECADPGNFGSANQIDTWVEDYHNTGPDSPYVYAYPCPHQVGQGYESGSHVLDPIYLWNQSGARAYTITYRSPTMVQINRDIYANSGPKPGYVKYTYPHPLRR